MEKYLRKAFTIFMLSVLLFIPFDYHKAFASSVDADIVIGSNDSFYLHLKEDGTVWGWGDNDSGQLGDGTNNKSSKPVLVKGLTDVIHISAGTDVAVAVKKDGTVWGWGDNSNRQLGKTEFEQTNKPFQITSIQDVAIVELGSYHTIAVKNDGSVWVWGFTSTEPKQIEGVTNVVDVEVQGVLFQALKEDGTIWQWGIDRRVARDAFTSPIQIEGISDVIDISTNGHKLALKKDGTVWSWGANSYGQLGDGTNVEKSTPVKVKGLENIVDISAGAYHSVAVKKDGTVWVWGSNNDGQLGLKKEKVMIDPNNFREGYETKNYSTPVKLSITGVDVAAAGTTHSVAVKQDGSQWIWGNEVSEISRVTSAQNYVIEPKYNYVKSFSEGLAFADGSFINQTGNKVLQLPFNTFIYNEDAYMFKDGLATVSEGKEGSGSGVTPYYGVIDKSGKLIVPTKYQSTIGEFNNGLANIYVNGKNGFINKNGVEVIKPQYDAYGYEYEFNEGYSLAHKGDKYGFIDTTGKVVISLKYSHASNFNDGLAVVAVEGKDGSFKYGYIDKTDKKVIAPQYNYVTSFNEGVAVVSNEEATYIIDKAGKRTKITGAYYYFNDFDTFHDGLFRVSEFEHGETFINKSGKRISKYYSSVTNFKDGFATVVDKSGKYGFINTAGKEIVSPKYELAFDFNEGLAVVKSNGKFGFINNEGKELIKPQFEDAKSFSEGLAAVKVNGKWGYIANPLKIGGISSFKDYKEGEYWVDSFEWGISNNVIKGDTVANRLNPNKNITEAQWLAMLLRYAMPDEAKDSTSGDWYNNYYTIASKEGIIVKNSPNKSLRRGDVAKMLAKVYLKRDLTEKESVQWLYDNDITTGVDSSKPKDYNNFNPNGNITRAQAVTFMYRLNEKGVQP